MDTTKPGIGLQWALLPILLTIIVLDIQLFVFDTFTPQVPLVLGIGFAALVGRWNGTSWKDMEEGMLHVVSVGLPAIGILTLGESYVFQTNCFSPMTGIWKGLVTGEVADGIQKSRCIYHESKVLKFFESEGY